MPKALRTILALVALLAFSFGAYVLAAKAVEPITLRVALYPYVPDRAGIFLALAKAFQHDNEGVTLEPIELDPSQDYYDRGLLDLDADVYEIDTVLLSDMIPRIAPLSLSLGDFSPQSVEAVTRNGAVYAVPHWMCGNFLFYRKGDAAIHDAETWRALVGELRGRNRGLFVDFFGKSTLGEWYLTMRADRLGAAGAQAEVMKSDKPSPQAISALNSILAGCSAGFCRNQNLHYRAGYYARAFVRGEASVYIGYSETIHYGLQDGIDSCSPQSDCLSENEIAVRRLPALEADSVGEGVGWVDGLAIAAGLSGRKRDIALKFIEYATSPAAYQAILRPADGEAPRYLLPARTGLALDKAPLYPEFFAAHTDRKTGTEKGLNAQLRALGKNLNCALPIDRTDTDTMDKCKVH
jgi:thiamine pyridinylase